MEKFIKPTFVVIEIEANEIIQTSDVVRAPDSDDDLPFGNL